MKKKYICALLVLASCAQKQIVIKEEGLKASEHFGEMNNSVFNSPSISVLEIIDLRQNKDSLGMASSGFYNQRVPVQVEGPVSDFIKSRWTKGLEKRGFRVSEEAKYGFQGKLKTAWVKEEATGYSAEFAKCEFEMDFSIIEIKSRQTRYTGKVTSQALGGYSILDATDAVGPVLESCISIAINSFIEQETVRKVIGIETGK